MMPNSFGETSCAHGPWKSGEQDGVRPLIGTSFKIGWHRQLARPWNPESPVCKHWQTSCQWHPAALAPDQHIVDPTVDNAFAVRCTLYPEADIPGAPSWLGVLLVCPDMM